MNKDKKIGKILIYSGIILFTLVSVWETFANQGYEMQGAIAIATLFFVSLPMMLIGAIFVIKN